MKRREFLKLLIAGAFLILPGKKSDAKEKPKVPLKEGMFWKRLN